jgi:U3 small nucleolar RNA-associated protein 18
LKTRWAKFGKLTERMVAFQLFFVDTSLPNQRIAGESSSESESEAEDGVRRKPRRNAVFNADGQSDDEEDSEESGSEQAEEEATDYESDDSSGSGSSRSSTVNPFAKNAGSKASQTKQVLWHDPADDQVRVDLAADNRLRKLAKGKTGKEAVVGGKGLESKLREQFQKMHPSPAWASKEARTTAKSTQPQTTLESLMSSTQSFIAKAVSRGALPKGSLDIERLRDANYQARSAEGEKAKKGANGKGQQAQPGGVINGGVADVKFHPNVEVLSVIGGDRRLRLFTVSTYVSRG